MAGRVDGLSVKVGFHTIAMQQYNYQVPCLEIFVDKLQGSPSHQICESSERLD